jgi:hypothetical protein
MTSDVAASPKRPSVPEQLQVDGGPTMLTALLGALTLARLAALAASPSELGFDEAPYWAWSRATSRSGTSPSRRSSPW